MKALLLLILLSVPSVAQEFLIGESICVGLIAADWRQTRGIAKKGWITHDKRGWLMHSDRNPIMGKTPGVPIVDAYMASAIVLHVLVAKKLPKPLRYAFWIGTIALQVKVIHGNHKKGLKIL